MKIAPEIKTIRSLESQLASSQSRLRLEQQKRSDAEAELVLAHRNLETFLQTQSNVKPDKLRRRAQHESRGSATAILCCNDWHCEGCVTRESVDGANEFNLQIASQRINRTWQKALYLLDFARTISNIRDLVVWLGGDLINGTIHEELEESNFLGPAEAVVFVQDHVATGLELLLREAKVNRITVATSFGNHGRTTKRRRISTGYRHSWEWLAYNNLAHYFRNRAKIGFKIEQGYHNWLPIQGHDVRFHHGDAIQFGGGVGGVAIPLRKKIAQWNKRRPARLDVLGHFHQFLDGWDHVVCGCLVGYDAYALEIGAEFQQPTQTFIVMDRQYGKVLTVPIFCG
jgi:Calcineurin-like phosphoesterase